jgi:hypothetical protein
MHALLAFLFAAAGFFAGYLVRGLYELNLRTRATLGGARARRSPVSIARDRFKRERSSNDDAMTFASGPAWQASCPSPGNDSCEPLCAWAWRARTIRF